MKVSQLLLPYLLQNKSFQLEGLGKITLDNNAATASEDSNTVLLPKGSVHFEANKKAGPDLDFIAFISKQSGKIKPLATSDLESFTEIGKQLLYISKPFILDGIGLLQMDMHRKLEFVQDEISADGHIETGSRKLRAQEDGVQFDDDYRHPSDKKGKAKGSNALVIILMVAGLALIGYVAYFFYNKSKEKQETETPVQARQLVLSSPPEDSLLQNNSDTSANNGNLPAVDTSAKIVTAPPIEGFKIVLEIAKQQRAIKRFADLKEWGHKVIMTTSDSVEYKISIPVIAPLKDTTRYRDSLTNFFGKRVWVEVDSTSRPSK